MLSFYPNNLPRNKYGKKCLRKHPPSRHRWGEKSRHRSLANKGDTTSKQAGVVPLSDNIIAPQFPRNKSSIFSWSFLSVLFGRNPFWQIQAMRPLSHSFCILILRQLKLLVFPLCSSWWWVVSTISQGGTFYGVESCLVGILPGRGALQCKIPKEQNPHHWKHLLRILRISVTIFNDLPKGDVFRFLSHLQILLPCLRYWSRAFWIKCLCTFVTKTIYDSHL